MTNIIHPKFKKAQAETPTPAPTLAPSSTPIPGDPWWFMQTPLTCTIGKDEKILIANTIAASVPIGYLIQLSKDAPGMTLVDFVNQHTQPG